MSTQTPILMSEKGGRRAVSKPARPVPWSYVVAAGVAFTIIGWTDVLLLWYPVRFGNVEWEFATVSAMFDSLPLGTIGLVALAVAARMTGSRLGQRAVAVFTGLAALVFMGAYVLFALSFIQGWQTVPADVSWVFLRAGVKASLFALVYVVLYGWLSFTLLRTPRIRERT